MRHAERLGGITMPRGVLAALVPERRDAPGLVVRHPVADTIAEPLGHRRGVERERLGRVTGAPSAPFLQRLRQVPVVKRHERPDAGLEERVDEPLVEIEPGVVDRAAAVGQNARPRDRETVRTDPERAHQGDVFAPAVIVIAGHARVRTIGDVPGDRREAVPDRFAAPAFVDRPFDLVRRRRDAPQEVVGEGLFGHGAPFPG